MQLLDLPLDLFQYLMAFIARDFDYHENIQDFLRLRLVNCTLFEYTRSNSESCSSLILDTMNVETLWTLATPSFFQSNYNWNVCVRGLKTGPFFQRTYGSAPCTIDRQPAPSSYLEFLVSFLELRPHTDAQTPWNANLSSMLNCIVDTLLLADGLSVDDEMRRDLLERLVCGIFEIKKWKTLPDCISTTLYPTSPPTFAEQTESFAFNMLLSNILLGRRTTFLGLENVPGLLTCKQDVLSTLSKRKSLVFGTLLEVCIKSGQTELVTALLETLDIDLNDDHVGTFDMAVQSDNLGTLRLLFSKYQARHTLHPDRINRAVHDAIANDRTDAALYIIYECNLWNLSKDHVKNWVGDAALRNNFRFLKVTLGNPTYENPTLQDAAYSHQYEAWVPGTVVFFGHQDMVRYLWDDGFSRNPVYMLQAAIASGHISMVRFLLVECSFGIGVSADKWLDLLNIAIVSATPRHTKLVKALFTYPNLCPRLNVSAETVFQRPSTYTEIFRHACGHGNVFMVQKLAEGGADLNRLDGYEDTPPVLVALLAGQSDVVKALIELGAKPIDPKETKFRRGFEDGSYPEEWERRQVSMFTWWHPDIMPRFHRVKVLKYK
jgi:hypothetical protein